ncbi:MAG: hypothetical protein PHE17_07525 [Thiothrix sp.]|uniref:hypothetical protein n=1 Tax=Thiothrix sp. TaxID=1032 RepID=UPI0026297B96|nr:hypothetical protein [Thiothrix sp.]MDD5392855.1 hypothetical protein [Thiothrix sp.]
MSQVNHHKAPLAEIHRQHLAAARGLRQAWRQSLEQDGLTTDAEARELRIRLISHSHYWLDAATEARRQVAHKRTHGERMVGFRFVTSSFIEYNREYRGTGEGNA